MDATVINHPDYYKRNGLEAIDIIEEYNLNFSEGSIVKYLWRMGLKDGEVLEKDQKKALWYFDRESQRIAKIKNITLKEGMVELYMKLNDIIMRDDLNMVEAQALLFSHLGLVPVTNRA